MDVRITNELIIGICLKRISRYYVPDVVIWSEYPKSFDYIEPIARRLKT